MVNNEGVSAVARGPWGGPARERLWYLIFRCAHVLRFEQSPFSNSALTFGKTFVPIREREPERERGIPGSDVRLPPDRLCRML